MNASTLFERIVSRIHHEDIEPGTVVMFADERDGNEAVEAEHEAELRRIHPRWRLVEDEDGDLVVEVARTLHGDE